MGRFLLPVSDTPGYKYGVFSNFFATDPWVTESLKLFDGDLYERTRGWSKRGATVYELRDMVLEQAKHPRRTEHNFAKDELVDWEFVKRQAIAAFSCDGFRVEPLTLDQALEDMELNSSAGYGFPGKKKIDVVDVVRARAEQRLTELRAGWRVSSIPCMIGTRGVLHLTSNPKRRAIYNVPFEQVLIERCFAKPITDKQKLFPEKAVMFFGKNLLSRLRRLLQKDYGPGSQSVRTDFDKYDRTLSEWLLEQGFEVIENLLDFEHWQGKAVSPATQKRYRRLFDYVVEYFIHTPVMLFDGTMVVLHGGVPSGSAFTQLIESIITYMLLYFVAIRTGHGVSDIKTLGDDGKIDLAGRPNLELWAELLLRWFGVILSTRKSKIFGRRFGQKQFLGYDIRSGYLERDRDELFRLLVYPERDVDCIEKSFTRLIAYMFLGGVNDLRFSQFFEFYQSCYAIDDVAPQLDYDLETKRKYAGFDMPLKSLRQYTLVDFRRGLFNYEM
jgi:hypothetical protein